MLTAFVTTVLAAATALAGAPSGGPPGTPEEDRGDQNRLVITVSESGEPTGARSYELSCDPAGGDHPRAGDACAELKRATADGDPFAPVPEDAMCTQIYGGPAHAEVTGRWAGVVVEAEFSRANGCEIARWDGLATVLGGEEA